MADDTKPPVPEAPAPPTPPSPTTSTLVGEGYEHYQGHSTTTLPAEPEATPVPPTPVPHEGDTGVELRLDLENDQVIVDFKKLLSWVGLRPEQARLFAKILWQKAAELEKALPRAKVIRLPVQRKSEEPPK